jgi:uncharacterized protein (TIGR02569 family)
VDSGPAPPDEVLSAFGRPLCTPRRLGGGRGRAWSAADLVLKPVDDEAEASWVGNVLSVMVEDGFRINRPVPSAAGAWVVDGWSAWQRLPGDHDTSGRWGQVLRTGERLNAALSGLPRPDFLASRTHAWAIGDRVAWDEESADLLHEELQPLAARLTNHVRPDDDTSQVIHGDLAGNVLFAPGLHPGVIDFTPYWRPPRFSLAVVVVDALLWHGAPASLADELPGADDRRSLLARAALFRLVTSDRLAADREPAARRSLLRSTVAEHRRVLACLDGGLSR